MTTRPATALVVVDMQNGFISSHEGGGVPGAQEALVAVEAWLDRADAAGWPVLLTRDVDPFGGSGEGAAYDAALHPTLHGRGTVVEKGPGSRSGFSGFVLAADAGSPGGGGLSTLAGLLRQADVGHLVVVGLAADVCVSSTALDARRLGFEVTVPLTATAFVHARPDGDRAAVAAMTGAGVKVTDQETG